MANTFVGQNAEQFEKGLAVTVDRVIVKVGDDSCYYAPPNLTDAQWNAMTGKIITVTIPFGTQAIANSLLATLSSKTFRPYSAICGDLDPASEIGDYVTINGLYSLIANQTLYLNDRASSDFSASAGNVVTDKYPYLSKADADTQRKIADVISRLSVAEDNIEAEVTARQNADSALQTAVNGKVAYTELSTKIGEYVDTTAGTAKIVSACSGTYLTQTGAANTYTTITRTANIESAVSSDEAKLALVVSTSGGSSSINTAGIVTSINNAGSSVKINADKIQMTGTTTFLTASDVGESGSTVISGDRITTGTISAEYISTDIAQVSEKLYIGDPTYYGAYVESFTSGAFSISCDDGYITFNSSTVSLGTTDSSQYLTLAGNAYIRCYTPNSMRIAANALIPWSDGSCGMGYSNYRWGQIYSTNGSISTSDRKEKTEINYNFDVDELFDNFKPCSYKFVNGTSGRTHYGMVSQDIEDELIAEGKTGLDFAGFCKDQKTVPVYDDEGKWIRDDVIEGEYRYGLRYEEFIALCISQIQKLKARVAELETKAN